MWLRGDGTHRRARLGTHRSNQLGLRVKCSLKKSSHCLRTFRHPPFDQGLEFPAGTRAGFAKATARIHGTGWRWRNSLASPRMSDTRPDAGGKVHRCERWRLPQNLTLACTWQSITVQNGPIQAGSPEVASQLPIGATSSTRTSDTHHYATSDDFLKAPIIRPLTTALRKRKIVWFFDCRRNPPPRSAAESLFMLLFMLGNRRVTSGMLKGLAYVLAMILFTYSLLEAQDSDLGRRIYGDCAK